MDHLLNISKNDFVSSMILGGHKIVRRRRMASTVLHDSTTVDHRTPTEALRDQRLTERRAVPWREGLTVHRSTLPCTGRPLTRHGSTDVDVARHTASQSGHFERAHQQVTLAKRCTAVAEAARSQIGGTITIDWP